MERGLPACICREATLECENLFSLWTARPVSLQSLIKEANPFGGIGVLSGSGNPDPSGPLVSFSRSDFARRDLGSLQGSEAFENRYPAERDASPDEGNLPCVTRSHKNQTTYFQPDPPTRLTEP